MMPRPTTSFLSVQVLVVGQKMKKLFWIWNTFVLSQVQKRIEGKKNYVCANPSPPKNSHKRCLVSVKRVSAPVSQLC